MAARKNPHHVPRVIARIRLAQLVDKLEKNALGELRYPTGGKGGSKRGETKPYEMTAGQIESTKFLISRLIPQAAQKVTLANDGEEPLKLACVVRFVAASPSPAP